MARNCERKPESTETIASEARGKGRPAGRVAETAMPEAGGWVRGVVCLGAELGVSDDR